MDTLWEEICHEQDKNGPCTMVLTFIPLVLKRKATADLPPALFALRTTLTHSGHNIQLPNVDL